MFFLSVRTSGINIIAILRSVARTGADRQQCGGVLDNKAPSTTRSVIAQHEARPALFSEDITAATATTTGVFKEVYREAIVEYIMEK